MSLKLCQGPECHTRITKDRLKGPAGSKTYQTRRRSNLLFDEFCSMNCQHDWITQHGTLNNGLQFNFIPWIIFDSWWI